MKKLPASGWNRITSKVGEGFLPVGPEQSIGGGGNLPSGRIPNRGRETVWHHPFQVNPVWSTEAELTEEEQLRTGRKKGAWLLYMDPGFVNGHAPAMSVPTKLIPDGAKVWGNRYGKETRAHSRLADRTQVLLTDEWAPYMKVTNFTDARSAIFGQDAPALPIEVPLFFRSMGAMPKPKPDFLESFFSMATAGGLSLSPTAGEAMVLGILQGGAGPTFVQGADTGDGFPEGDRYLHFVDVIMDIDRPRTRQIFQPDEFGFLRLAGFQIDNPDSGLYNARIGNVPVYLIPHAPTLDEIYFGGYVEPTVDTIVMARVFFLSPSEKMLDEDVPITPNGSWMPMARHEVFWNLSYAALNIYDPFHPNRDLDAFKVLGSVLAGGVAFLLIGLTADFIEVQHDTLSTFMNNTRVRTRFWTS